MSKNKLFIITGGVIVLLLAVSGGWLAWRGHERGAAAVAALVATAPTAPSTTSDSSGLAVSNSNGLGQLDLNTAAGTGSGATSNSSSSTSSGSGSASSANNPFDPTTFAKYEQYKNSKNPMFADVVKGTGTALAVNHTANIVYKGWLTNGTMFDQSKTDSSGKVQAFAFVEGAGKVIPGFEQGLAGMQAGGTRLLIIPPALGYGAAGQGPVPANAVLVFEVQLVSVQ